MKTLIIFSTYEEGIKFGIVEGDYSKFNGVFINGVVTDPKLEKECVDFLFVQNSGDMKIELSEDSSIVENKQWDKIAIITFL
jgi:hypothetical protein